VRSTPLLLAPVARCAGPRHASVQVPAHLDPAWDFLAVPVPGTYADGPWAADDARFACDRSHDILSLVVQRADWPAAMPPTVTCTPAHGAPVIVTLVVAP